MIVVPRSILLDAEPLSALAAGARTMQAWAAVARRTDAVLYASTVTLAEVADGSQRDVHLRQIVKAVRLTDVDPHLGFTAGRLRPAAASAPRKARDLTVDSVVAATATTLPPPVVVLTSDPHDLELLLSGTEIAVERIPSS
ncbi:hypothetical protein [Tsukamurella soli]|uniref:PIN domain-containing protein n=1 Tax=Tsukamurella soli TaxID=644556 RepID=A0ABP8K2C5_9ACTN